MRVGYSSWGSPHSGKPWEKACKFKSLCLCENLHVLGEGIKRNQTFIEVIIFKMVCHHQIYIKGYTRDEGLNKCEIYLTSLALPK